MELILDTARMPVGAEGHPDLAWPVGAPEVAAARRAMVDALTSAGRVDPTSDDPRRALGILFARILHEGLAAFYAQALVRRSREARRTVVPPPRGRLTQACLLGFRDEAAAVHRELAAGPDRGRRWLPPGVRHARWTWALNGPTARVAWPVRWDRDPVTVAAGAFIRARTRATPAIVRYVRDETWFRPLSGNRTEAPDAALTDLAVEAIGRGFRAGGESMEPEVRHHLQRFVERAVVQVTEHTRRLRAVKRLPATLWTGSGGQIWHRMLRNEVRRRGGVAVGHAHGTGGGYLDLDTSRFTDLDSCDVFVTFTKPHADAHRSFVRSDLLLQPRAPQIEGHGSGSAQSPPPATRPAPVRRAMYISSYYKGEQAGYSGFVPDAIQVDWEARLFHKLRDWGIQPVQKPHPSSVTAPPPGLGAEVWTEPFEAVMDRADVVLTTQIQSTAFVSALQARRPMVVIDLGFYKMYPGARKLLERACSFVKAGFDEDHRIEVPWEELREAIREAPARDDPAFYETYLNFSG